MKSETTSVLKITDDSVYELLKKVPTGKVTTYGDLGAELKTKAYRHIGKILSRNPNAPRVPCHRVVTSSGLIGGYKGSSTLNSIKDKIALLESEGHSFIGNKLVNFEKVRFRDYSH